MQYFSSISNQDKNQKSLSINNVQKKQSSFFKPIIQPKLTISQPNDIYEQEADAMADKVMRMPATENAFFKPAIDRIQRKCEHCEEEEKIRMKEADHGAGGITAPSAVHEVINSPGNSLDPGTRGFMESRFGYDFGNVQIHNDSLAHQSSADISAQAYTHGNHIVFALDQYQPHTYGGKNLLAHELTHVIQQNEQTPAIQRQPAGNNNSSQAGDNDMESFSKVAAEHYLRAERGSFFDTVKSIQCQAESAATRSCTITTTAGKTVTVYWATDTKRVIVKAEKNKMLYNCAYEYTAAPSQPVIFKKIKCWYS